MHSAWFVLPLLAALALSSASGNAGSAAQLRAMAAWAAVLSLVVVNGLRLAQVEQFVSGHLKQVPPLAQESGAPHQVIFVDPRNGFYSRDLVQNDPFLAGGRIIMLGSESEPLEGLMAKHFPDHRKAAAGPWGQHWIVAKP
jgi:hypothetical protein